MIQRLALSLCLLTWPIWAGGYIPTAYAQTVPPTVTQPEVTSNEGTLSLGDLPPGFRELPKEVEPQIRPRFEALAQQLAQVGMKPGKFFVFVNPQTFQIVFGFTGTLANQPDLANFDASLKQLQEPEFQRQMIDQYREALKTSQGIEILEYGAIPDANNIAESSTGMSVSVSMQGQPVRLDVAAFRRSNIGAFTAIMYPNDQTPSLKVDAIARKLDDRIIESSASIDPTNTTNPTVSPNTTPNPAQTTPSNTENTGNSSSTDEVK